MMDINIGMQETFSLLLVDESVRSRAGVQYKAEYFSPGQRASFAPTAFQIRTAMSVIN